MRWSSAAREKIWEQKLLTRSSFLCVVMSVKKTVSETGNELSDTALHFKPGVRIRRPLL